MSIWNNVFRSKTPYANTNIYNVTASLTPNFSNLSMPERVEAARKIIFNFEYPTPENIDSEIYKEFFETLFITKFIDDYFKFETFERWHVAFYSKMLEILPTYNAKLSNFFYQDKEKLFLNKTTTKTNNDRTVTRENKNISSKFPANLNRAGTNIESINYADDGNVDNGKDVEKSESSTENYSGNIFEKAIAFDDHYKNVFSQLMNEFNCLFSFLIHY